MKVAAVVIVFAGVGLTFLAAVEGDFDMAARAIVGAIVLVGGLTVAVAVRMKRGEVQPAHCASCGGLISPNAPYCKHCGSPKAQ